MIAVSEPSLFFVLGAPKSGTTWLQHALDRHPEVICKGEGKFHFFRDRLAEGGVAYNKFIASRNSQVFGEETFPPLVIEDIDEMFRIFVEMRLRGGVTKAGVRRLGSKDPDFGLFIQEYAVLFPVAAYLHILRDPRDACLSMWHHMRRVHPGVDKRSIDVALIDTARGWRNYVETTRGEVARRKLTYLEITYEAMIQSPQATLASAFGFLGVDTASRTLDTCVAASSFESLSKGRSPGQEDRSSFFRKGVAGGWRDELTEAQGAAILQAAGPVGRELGYR